MLTIQQLREKRNTLAADARNRIENKGSTTWTEAEQKSLDEVYASIEDCDAQLKRLTKLIDVENSLIAAPSLGDPATPGIGHNSGSERDLRLARNVLNAWAKDGVAGPSALLAKQPDVYQQFAPSIQAAAVSPTTAGGFLVPTILVPELLIRLLAFSGMRQWATVLATNGGQPFTYPTMDDTTDEGEIVAEGVAAANSDLVFGQATINAFKYSSKTIPVSIELLQDSAIDVDNLVFDALAARIARGQNRHFTIGTGTGQPMGAVTAASVGKTGLTGQTVTVIYDDLVDLEHSVDIAYRAQGAAYQMHDTTLRAIRKLKDTAGRPLYIPAIGGSLSERQPASINGYPFIVNNHMPVMAANAKSIMFGLGKKYLIRDSMQLEMYRFTDSAYARLGQVGFLCFARADGRVIDATGNTAASAQAIKVYQNSAT